MTKLEKIEYLERYGIIRKRIQRKLRRIEEIRINRMLPSGMNMDGMPKGSSGGDLSDFAVRVAEEYEIAEALGEEAKKIFSETMEAIEKLPSEDEKDVLTYWYIAGMQCDQIADKMECGKTKVYAIKQSALDHFEP